MPDLRRERQSQSIGLPIRSVASPLRLNRRRLNALIREKLFGLGVDEDLYKILGLASHWRHACFAVTSR